MSNVGILRRAVQIISESCKNWRILQKMPFYAVAKGRSVGIFNSWAECEAQVKGFSGARYKKFDTVNNAQDFVSAEGGSSFAPKQGKSYASSSNSISNNNKKLSYSSPARNKPTAKSNSGRSYHSQSSYKAPAAIESEDDSEDELKTIVTKQLDDIEKRLKSFEKGVDKIENNGKRKAIMIEPVPEKRSRTSEKMFEEDNEGYVQVYTDGACSANGRSEARAGIGVYWGDNHSLNISEPVSGRATNNCGEIQAATRAMKQAVENGVKNITINTDSKFLINSVTKWMPGWKRKGWKLQSGEAVKNEADFKDLDSVHHKLNVKWNYVEAHRGIHGNEMADQLAKAGASQYTK